MIASSASIPGIDGVSLCRAIRADGPNLGPESGADDYLTKPFGIRELTRQEIERDPQDSELILTAWGVGYKFVDT